MTDTMYSLCETLYPIHRHLMGEGVRQTLRILREHIPGLVLHEIPTGTECFDWAVPQEWKITTSRLKTPDKRILCDVSQNNLSVVQYSEPVCQSMRLAELQPHLYSDPKHPDAVPYVTSYYDRRWGFCLSQNERMSLTEGHYFVEIESSHFDGFMSYGEKVIPGRTKREVLLSTYICHPSLANDNVSGMVVAAWLAKWLMEQDNRYTYRLLFLPETIGSIYYLSQHMDHLRSQVVAGYVLTCLGDERGWSFLPSRAGNTLADRAALHVLRRMGKGFQHYSFNDRGSDERQYCAPGVDLPVASVMRSKYHAYPEYHTDADNLDMISQQGLEDSLAVYRNIIRTIELNGRLEATVMGEPMLSKHRLAFGLGGRKLGTDTLLNLLAYADGRNALDAADAINEPLWRLGSTIEMLKEVKLLK